MGEKTVLGTEIFWKREKAERWRDRGMGLKRDKKGTEGKKSV